MALGIVLGGSHVVRGLDGLQKISDMLSRFRAMVTNPGCMSEPLWHFEEP